MSAEPLDAHGVTRIYDGRAAVESVDLHLAPGRVTALLGPSGAGKSTLLRLLAGLEPLDRGEIRLGRKAIASPSGAVPAERRRIGLVFQDYALFPHLTAVENVRFGLNKRPKSDAQALATRWLDRLGLAARGGAYPHELSGGEQQRVAIARALAPEPVAILLDEPFSGLDPLLREDARAAALDAIAETGAPTLLVTHDAGEAMRSADTIAVMRAGRIVQTGDAETVYAQPCDPETAAALGPINRLDAAHPAARRLLEAAGAPSGRLTAAREEAVTIDQDSAVRARIVFAARSGPMTFIRLDCDGLPLRALVSPDLGLKVGMETGVSLDPKRLLVFPIKP